MPLIGEGHHVLGEGHHV